MKPVVEEVEALVARVGTHPIWGYTHCQRVYALAEELATAEHVSHDAEILRISALMHDIGLYKAYNLREATDHAQRSAAVAERTLRYGDFPPQATRIVLEAIEHHPPGASPGTSVESVLLKDAVALDYLGAVGLCRVLAMVGLEDDVSDLASAIRHAENLHHNIPGVLILETSQRLARDRKTELEDFVRSLNDATANLKLL